MIPVIFSGVGVIAFFDEKELRVSGAGFDLSLDLAAALFENTVTEEGLRREGANPALCGEGTDIVMDWGKVNLTTFLGTDKRN